MRMLDDHSRISLLFAAIGIEKKILGWERKAEFRVDSMRRLFLDASA